MANNQSDVRGVAGAGRCVCLLVVAGHGSCGSQRRPGPGPALALALAVLAAVLMAAAADASSALSVHSSTQNRRLKQDKCDQCNSCTCDANCDCTDPSTTAGTAAPAPAPTADTPAPAPAPSGGTPAPAPAPSKCDQCNSCPCDVNCDCIAPSPSKPETRTNLIFSANTVGLGKGVLARDIVSQARDVCDDVACNEDPIEIPMELWASGHTPGSVGHPSCTSDSKCGYYTGGTCTVRFEGETGSLDVRAALVDLLIVAADASQWPAMFDQQECTWFFFGGCTTNAQESNMAMPTFVKALRWVDVDGISAQAGMITVNVQCALDPRSDTKWGCVATDIAGTVGGAISGGAITAAAAAVLGAVAPVCEALA